MNARSTLPHRLDDVFLVLREVLVAALVRLAVDEALPLRVELELGLAHSCLDLSPLRSGDVLGRHENFTFSSTMTSVLVCLVQNPFL